MHHHGNRGPPSLHSHRKKRGEWSCGDWKPLLESVLAECACVCLRRETGRRTAALGSFLSIVFNLKNPERSWRGGATMQGETLMQALNGKWCVQVLACCMGIKCQAVGFSAVVWGAMHWCVCGYMTDAQSRSQAFQADFISTFCRQIYYNIQGHMGSILVF